MRAEIFGQSVASSKFGRRLLRLIDSTTGACVRACKHNADRAEVCSPSSDCQHRNQMRTLLNPDMTLRRPDGVWRIDQGKQQESEARLDAPVRIRKHVN